MDYNIHCIIKLFYSKKKLYFNLKLSSLVVGGAIILSLSVRVQLQ